MPKIVEQPPFYRAIDTETNGVDPRHGAKPFYFNTCTLATMTTPDYWQWEVDPLTREPAIPREDIAEIRALLKSDPPNTRYTLQNAKFDIQMMVEVGILLPEELPAFWEKVDDTLCSGHLLCSNQPHDLTSMVLIYLGINIKGYELALKEAVKDARSIARRKYPAWRIAKEGLPEMPSAKSSKSKTKEARGVADDSCASFDYWLPRAIAIAEDYPREHPWWTVLSEYANVDPPSTLQLHLKHMEVIEQRKLMRIYRERLKLLPIVHSMEDYGITISKARKDQLFTEYEEETAKSSRICVNLSNGRLETLPDGTTNALKAVLTEEFKLTPSQQTKKGNDSFNSKVLEAWELELPNSSPARLFVRHLRGFRSRKTAMSYLKGYEKFWRELGIDEEWYKLHPSLNPFGTDTLRFSSSNPNEQNISKKEGFNLRFCFGPSPGREWWSLDAKNIELRLPAYEADETAMIDLFERPDDAPYFGSNHLLAAHILHPEMFEACVNDKGILDGRIFKKKYNATWYQWVKNGNFAVQYGAIEKSGTADRAYHLVGAQAKIASRLGKIADLNQKQIAMANKYGFIETIPDRTVDPERGYPLYCSRTSWGGVLETVPLSYHIQGTAMWVMCRMMDKVSRYLQEISARYNQSYRLVMQVHDEIVLDFPYSANKGNLPIVMEIKKLMDSVGNNLIPAIPLPVGIEYHPNNWSEGDTCA